MPPANPTTQRRVRASDRSDASEEGSERREVQRHAGESLRPRPCDRLADEPLVEAVRHVAAARHGREGERGARGGDAEVEEPGRRSLLVEADDENGTLVLE